MTTTMLAHRELVENIHAVCVLYDVLEHWHRPTVTVAEVGIAMGENSNRVLKLFSILNIQPVAWDSPSDYRVADILESASRHEVSQRY